MGERPAMWMVATNVLNKQLRTVNKVCPPARVLDEVLATPHLKNWLCYET